jgi:hypothetical protein
MSVTDDDFDDLASDLVETDFDAVERGGLRAEWSAAGDRVTVTQVESGESVVYNPDDLFRAASDVEVRNAREPDEQSR